MRSHVQGQLGLLVFGWEEAKLSGIRKVILTRDPRLKPAVSLRALTTFSFMGTTPQFFPLNPIRFLETLASQPLSYYLQTSKKLEKAISAVLSFLFPRILKLQVSLLLVLSRGLLYLPSFPDCFLQRECSAARQCTAPLPMPNITTCCPSSGSAGLLWRSMLF